MVCFYLSRLESVFGRQASSAIEWVHAAMGGCGTQWIFWWWRACWKSRHRASNWAQTLLSLRRWDESRGEECRHRLLFQCTVHQVHGLGEHILLSQQSYKLDIALIKLNPLFTSSTLTFILFVFYCFLKSTPVQSTIYPQ